MVFKLDPAGNFSILHEFDGISGANPYAELVETDNGSLDGTTAYIGDSNAGTVFKLDCFQLREPEAVLALSARHVVAGLVRPQAAFDFICRSIAAKPEGKSPHRNTASRSSERHRKKETKQRADFHAIRLSFERVITQNGRQTNS